ncbi:hypothetical protein ACH5RR_031682 [Cinchona calisaya]|uniref:Uncharacterized protein n=1 Tax=Cinchona calisaya TaxID=153742 RepID=A0ABD2YFY6_9GENT
MCTDFGRNNGAGWPLLQTVFEVMIRRFSTPCKVCPVFVLRDKTKLWDKIPKPHAEVSTELSDRFKWDMGTDVDKFRDEIKQRQEREHELGRILNSQIQQKAQDDEDNSYKVIMGIFAVAGLIAGLPFAAAS